MSTSELHKHINFSGNFLACLSPGWAASLPPFPFSSP